MHFGFKRGLNIGLKCHSKLVLALFILVACPALAKSKNASAGLNFESGANGTYGIVGFEGVYFPSESLDLHAGAGIGLASAMSGVGFRLYSKGEECFLFKHCFERYFFGTTVSRTLTSNVTEISDGVERSYRIPRTTFINPAIGSSTVLFDRLNIMLHIGYKFAIEKNVAEQVYGPEDNADSKPVDLALKSGPQVSVGLGFVF